MRRAISLALCVLIAPLTIALADDEPNADSYTQNCFRLRARLSLRGHFAGNLNLGGNLSLGGGGGTYGAGFGGFNFDCPQGYQFAAPQCPPVQYAAPQQPPVQYQAPTIGICPPVCPPSDRLAGLLKLEAITDRIADEQRYQTHLLYQMVAEQRRQADLQLIAVVRRSDGNDDGAGPTTIPHPDTVYPTPIPPPSQIRPTPVPAPGDTRPTPMPTPYPNKDIAPPSRSGAPTGLPPAPQSLKQHVAWPQVARH
jgi:hypothetical protein